jgi:hypothetical protein
MAYAATIAKVRLTVGNREHLIVTVTETGVTGATDETTLPDLPRIGHVTEVDAVLTAGGGSATTIDTRIGESTTAADVLDNGTPAATIHDTSNGRRYTKTDGKLYLSSRANGTTTGVGNIVTRITIALGHL